MTKKIATYLIVGTLIFSVAVPATFAQTASSTANLNALIASLTAQIADLQAKLNALKSAQLAVQTTNADVQITLQAIAGLREGMTSDQVTQIQALLAADVSVYPEGLVTGYYGPLTARAIAKFKEKYEKRREKFNERTKEKFEKMREKMAKMEERHEEEMDGTEDRFEKKKEKMENKFAKKNCGIPPGLLTAPGYQKTHYDNWRRLMDEWIRCHDGGSTGTTTPDTTAPIISSLLALNVTHTGAKISWTTNESATNKVYYSTVSPVNLGTASVASTASSTTYHEVNLSGLTASTTYYFVAESKDASGNTATSSQQSFLTFAL